MEDAYPNEIIYCQAENAWQTGPIALECCGVPSNWGPGDGPLAFQWALDQHASVVHLKSSPLPSEWLNDYRDMIRLLGYRFVVLSLEHPAAAPAGGSLAIDLTLDNLGVAPCYFDYRLAVRLSGRTLVSSHSIRHLLPGSHPIHLDLQLPAVLSPGEHVLEIGIVDPGDSLPVVRLAIEGREPDGWYPLSVLSVF